MASRDALQKHIDDSSVKFHNIDSSLSQANLDIQQLTERVEGLGGEGEEINVDIITETVENNVRQNFQNLLNDYDTSISTSLNSAVTDLSTRIADSAIDPSTMVSIDDYNHDNEIMILGMTNLNNKCG